MIAREQQFAEKLYAYKLQRNSSNSRVNDIGDMTLLIASGGLDRRRVLNALNLTFERRGTHDLPASLDSAPLDWRIPFRTLVEECRLSGDLAVAFAEVQKCLNEVRAITFSNGTSAV